MNYFKYYIFLLSIRLAKWSCSHGFVFDHLDAAEDLEVWHRHV
jgi:hypothetical protein